MSITQKALLALVIAGAFVLTGCTLGPTEDAQEAQEAQETGQESENSENTEQENGSTESESGPETTEDNSSPVDVGNSTEPLLEEIPFPIQ